MPKKNIQKMEDEHREKVEQIKREADTKRRRAADYIEKIQEILNQRKLEKKDEELQLGENHA
jgi:hypothetical protein